MPTTSEYIRWMEHKYLTPLRRENRKLKRIAQWLIRVLCASLAIIIALSITLIVKNSKHKEAEKKANDYLGVIAKMNAEKIEATPEVMNTSTDIEPYPLCLGEFDITYYCPCSECCGQYGYNRPKVNNKEVVTTSTGAFAQEGITIAVDPDVIPYGSLVYIEGIGYRIAQDCGGAIKGNRIDVYITDHNTALEMGNHKLKVYLIQGGN